MKINHYLHAAVAVHTDNMFYHVVLLNLYLIDMHIYSFHIRLNNYEDYSHIMVEISMNNQDKENIFHYLKYNLNFDNVLKLFYMHIINYFLKNN